MHKSKKNKILVVTIFISMFLVIPNLLISTQRDIKTSNNEKKPNEIINTLLPQESSVYYENTTGYAIRVYVSGNYVYVADDASGLAVIDISDPTNPGTPVYENIIVEAYGVYVSGNYAYVAIGYLGLAVIDISNPTNPGAPVYKDTSGEARGVYVTGNYVYMADGYSGLAIIDISDPTNPGAPVFEDTTGYARNVYVSGDYAFVAVGTSGLAVIDISDPTNPGTPVYEDTIGYARDIYVSGDYAYVADNSGLAVINISDPINPGTPVYEDTTGLALGVYLSGNYAYVANRDSGLAVINISDPMNPGTPVYEDTTGLALGVYLSGDYAYVADYASGLAVIEISEPINPGTPVYEDTTGYAQGVYVSGDYAYVADSGSGLAIIDISDPTNPGTPVYEDTTGYARGIYVSGDYAYVADSGSGLAVIDISDPTNPGAPIYEDTTGGARDIYVSGNYAYVADGSSGLAVIDITDPTNPGTPVYEYTSDNAEGVYVSGDYAYVADYTSGLAVIDISNPTNPGTPVYEDTTGGAYGVYISGDYAYVADDSSGLAIIEVSDPTNPGTPVYEDTTGWSYGVYVSGDYAYVADSGLGLAVIDIFDPTNPGTPIYEDTTGGALDVHVSGDYAYVTTGISGLAVIQVRKRVDMIEPIITNIPSDFIVEYGYTGVSISWTATDSNPKNYMIELQGTGVVAGPSAWLSGTAITYNVPNGLAIGDYFYTVNFTDDNDNYITDTIKMTVTEIEDPIIINAPSDFTVDYGYTGVNISWAATDTSPNIYIIELQGTGIVAGPSAWSNGTAIMYNLPNGLSVGEYIFTVNFTDDYDNFVTDTVKMTVIDETADPLITDAPSDFTVEYGYAGVSILWIATDANPNTYTIELQGSGIVVGPTSWTSGVAIVYNIPDGFSVGSYIYTVNFTDDFGNSETDSVTFTVDDTTNPSIISSPSDIIVEFGYTGQSLSWTAIDPHPNTYTIELQGSGIVVGPTAWTSGVAINYNIPDGFSAGSYIYIVNFTDDYGNSAIDSVTFIVEDTTRPIVTSTPSDLTVELGYTGQSFSWTATDSNPDSYTIELQGSGIVAGPTTWTSGVAIVYNIPDGFSVGSYIYIVNFTDDFGNSIIDSAAFMVEDTTDPIITINPIDLTIELGYTGYSFSWTATDANPDTYTIELQGSGIVIGPTAWTSGVAITYNIPDVFGIGNYTYNMTFSDESGNSISNIVKLTINSTPEGAIPFELIIIVSVIGGGAVIGVAVLIFMRRKRN